MDDFDEYEQFHEDLFEQQRETCWEYEDFLNDLRELWREGMGEGLDIPLLDRSMAPGMKDTVGDAVAESGGNTIRSGRGFYSLLPGEGEIGTYRDLLDAGEVGDNITPYHMPSAEYVAQHGVGKKGGLCMNMEMPSPGTGGRHRMTDTYGRNMTDAEKAYYYSLSPRDALAYDIANMRQIYQSQGLYSEIRPKVQEYIK